MRIGGRMKLAVVLAVLAAGLFGAWRQSAREKAKRENGVETSLLRSWARSETGAGISILPLRVPVARARDLRALEDLPGFHEYSMRCSSCHALPDPAAYAPRQWIGTVDRMRHQIARAGVMPPREGELEAATEFLRAASESLRGASEGR